MDEDFDLRDGVTSCRRLNFGQGNTASNHLQYENENEEKLEEVVDLKDRENTMEDNHLISEASLPRIGKEFDSENEAYEFYNQYARAKGFSIRRSTIHKHCYGNIINITFCCSCEGERKEDKRDVNVKSHRPETRTCCCARMKISNRHSKRYVVVEFIAEHIGHILVSPIKVHLLRFQRKITTQQAALVDNIDKAGIAPKAGLDYMAQQAGGRENVGFILEDLRNYLHSRRTAQMKDGDAAGVLNYLQLMQSKDPNFLYAIQVDIDDLIINIFWTGGEMMADYMYFGDVICFDTTYRKNKDGRPFAPFVGYKMVVLIFCFSSSKC